MKLHHSFVIGAPVDQVWSACTDMELMGHCLPGTRIATVSDGDFTGSFTVGDGEHKRSYQGFGRVLSKDDVSRSTVIYVKAIDGKQLVTAKMSLTVTGSSRTTSVSLETDLDFEGGSKQLAPGLMQDLSRPLVTDLASCLESYVTDRSSHSDLPGSAATGRNSRTGSADPDATAIADPHGQVRNILIARWLPYAATVLGAGFVLWLLTR